MMAVAARGKRPEQAMLLGLPLIPVLLYPGNYYIHFVFLLPLLVEERPGTRRGRRPAFADRGGHLGHLALDVRRPVRHGADARTWRFTFIWPAPFCSRR